jgi:hypothetical protein
MMLASCAPQIVSTPPRSVTASQASTPPSDRTANHDAHAGSSHQEPAALSSSQPPTGLPDLDEDDDEND